MLPNSRGHCRSSNFSLSVKCLFKSTLFLPSFYAFAQPKDEISSNSIFWTAQSRQSNFSHCLYWIVPDSFCLCGKFKHRKLKLLPDVISLKQIVYSSFLMNHLYLATDFNPFLLMPDSTLCSWGDGWTAVCANYATAVSWLASWNTSCFQWNTYFIIPCSLLYIIPVFFSLTGNCSEFH